MAGRANAGQLDNRIMLTRGSIDLSSGQMMMLHAKFGIVLAFGGGNRQLCVTRRDPSSWASENY